MKPETPVTDDVTAGNSSSRGWEGAKGDLEIGFIFFFRSTAIAEEKAASAPLIVSYTEWFQ